MLLKLISLNQRLGVVMKYLTHVIAAVGMVFLMSGCFASSQSKLDGMNAGTCTNPKCSCPKPCQCGAGCKCGIDGNSNAMKGN